ncbi:MAG: beta-ketoacyl-[acyl-carrier-protein] synthase family protein [Planctomycetota bacterium]|nr:MAG: beta-ketoacyl-[acyl-carrier-protein] synthase family protein [Planctomycetota bacterium]
MHWCGFTERRRVVITGIDAHSVLGPDLETISQSLRSGTPGIFLDPERQALGFRSALCGRLPPLDGSAYFDRKQRKNMGQTALMAAVTAKRAIAMSGCAELLQDNPRAGLLYGNDSCAEPFQAVLDTVREQHTTTPLGSNRVIQALNSTSTINLGPLLRTQGISMSVSGACASGAHAIGMAWLFISSGMQDMMVCGGSQETCWESMAAFDALRVFSMRTDNPAGAVRPFDAQRDGLVPSGGAASLVVEEREAALARGAPIIAEVLGYAYGSDGSHLTTASGEGAARCMRECLEVAGLQPQDVDYINAHATGTEAGDAAEGWAINHVFGAESPWVSSTKSLTGHECWMAGASEAIYTLLMMRGGFIAPNRNYQQHDPKIPPFRVAASPQEGVKLRTCLSNSFGFGGTNACLALRME